ncbi:MAG TPA: alpha/beta hydrolase [Polyangiaceae bacterium]|nr:alpha/beta hydrolase [Polyangiaceae bacterium]
MFASPSEEPRRVAQARGRRRRHLAAIAALVSVAAFWAPAAAHVRAAALLTRVAHPDAPGWAGSIGAHPVEERDATIGALRAREYVPLDDAQAPGVVVVHGVHYRGIDEPRLTRFAHSLAQSGIRVLTPEVRELCEYTIDPQSVETIGAAARALSVRLGGHRVGILGFSFGGGLSLVAAADPRFERLFAFVVAVGAHDDLGRVFEFFVRGESPRPDGSTLRLRPHDYGPVVLVGSHAEDFFSPADVPSAREALRLWLHEDFDAARARAAGLSPAGAATIGRVFAHDVQALAPELSAEVARLETEFAAVSPSAHLARLRVPVFLLHGAGDTVIPPSETLWLAHDTPPADLRDVLVSHAIEHVEMEQTGLGDELALVHFMADVLLTARASR